jgi:tRNA/rRNA methyltransferase
MLALLDRIRIVLIEPAGARNVGAIARVMKNMRLSQLWMVNPECDWLGDEARHMAVHAADVLAAARICGSLPEALAGCSLAVATIGRQSDRAIMRPRVAMEKLLATLDQSGNELLGAVIFGREDHGLNNVELDHAQVYVSIPTSAEYQSLNLAQAVGILAYELQLAVADASRPAAVQTNTASSADLAQIEAYFQDLQALLLEIGYLHEHTAVTRMAKLRDVLRRSEPNATDVAMLRGMIRQMKWAIGQRSLPDD